MASGSQPSRWHCRGRSLTPRGRPLVMGILNVTPDSFSDGSHFFSMESAVEQGLRMVADGADIIDIGGESTRPGAAEVPPEEEARRVIPVVHRLAALAPTTALSIDTRKAEVARAALDAGACIVNDVSACTHDPAMAGVVSGSGAGVVLMHMRGTPETMQADPRYADVVADVASYLRGRIDALAAAGVPSERCAVDPGIGFGKTVEHNLALLAGLDAFHALGATVLVGLSRKSFIGHLTGRPVGERLAGSLAGALHSALHGAQVLRVHDVRETVDALKVFAAISAARESRGG